MSLYKSRAVLRLRLLSGEAFNKGAEAKTLALMEDWWFHYKAWERQDTFLAAFRQGRMTIRQGPDSQTYGVYQGRDSGIAFTARRGEVEGKAYPAERYRTGVDSVKERLNPSTFGMDQGERLKYKHGLHDLSGSLCTPAIPKITSQVRWKWGKLASWVTIFMPMAQPEDLATFHLLNSKAKQARAEQPNIYARVADMRRQISRIKLADSVDIGAGLHDVAADGSDPKLRYGRKELGDKGQPTGVDLERQKKALDYPSILPTSAKATNMNEIVIAYRQHEGIRFPLFAKWNKEKNAFECLPDEPSSKTIAGELIPDTWADTVQA